MKKHAKHAWRHGFGNVKHAKGAWYKRLRRIVLQNVNKNSKKIKVLMLECR